MADHEPGVYFRPDGTKTFIPLENNPEVFTDLIHRLGISSDLGFYDVYSIDEPDLLSLIPRPVHALIFIAPPSAYQRVREQDGGTKDLTYDGSGDKEPVMWFQQTIGHACGLYALIHSIGNGPAKNFIRSDSLLDRLLREALPLKPVPRAAVLYDSRELEKAHMASAVQGDTAPPMASEPCGHHFISFVRAKDGHLWELEGGWNGPIDRGAITDDEDGLSEKALELGIRRYVKAAGENIDFSIVALATRPEAERAVNRHG